MSTRGHAALHAWHQLGVVTVDGGTIAIVDPDHADHLTDAWVRRLEDMPANPFFNHEELPAAGAVVLATWGNGTWPVQARFCDRLGDGHMTICEVRIPLHDHDLRRPAERQPEPRSAPPEGSAKHPGGDASPRTDPGA